jgi:hypothetical protein
MKPFTTLAALIFALMALVHLYRLIRPFELVIGGWTAPLWISGVGVAIPALLAFMLWRESRPGR